MAEAPIHFGAVMGIGLKVMSYCFAFWGNEVKASEL